jgi:hypothetical protein
MSAAIAKSSGEILLHHGLAAAARYRQLAVAKASAWTLRLIMAGEEWAAWAGKPVEDVGRGSRPGGLSPGRAAWSAAAGRG